MTSTDATAQPPTDTSDRSPKVFLETFGCQMNVLDSQLVEGQLRALGYRFIDNWEAADVVIYNTCSVREHAEQKVYSRIGRVMKHKDRARPDLVLGIIGCMAERDGLDMAKRFPAVNILCGPGELDKLPQLLDNAVRTTQADRHHASASLAGQNALQGNTHRRSATLTAAADDLELLDLSRSFSPDQHHGSAYVRITRGCNKFCTYCVVPNTRGAEVHRPPDSLVDECRKLVESGVAEITLLGQTVNHYHYNNAQATRVNNVLQPQIGAAIGPAGPKGGSDVTTFADLLARIHDEIPQLQRLRFVTSFPRDFGDDILQVIADRPRIARYLHLPVQSGSNRVLKAMNRGYEIAEYEDLLVRARRIIPDLQIASDLICGFPGETEDDHQMTCDLIRRARYKNCFIFKYSPRPGTAAIDRFEDDVPDEVKKRRNNELLAIQNEISSMIHAEQVGRTERVFVESISHREKKARNAAMVGAGVTVTLGWEQPRERVQLTGRTEGDLIVMFDGEATMVGEFVDVVIESAGALVLFGRKC